MRHFGTNTFPESAHLDYLLLLRDDASTMYSQLALNKGTSSLHVLNCRRSFRIVLTINCSLMLEERRRKGL